MDVASALHTRRSVRAFLQQRPPAQLVQSLLEQAARAASGGNVQPWRVVALTGAPLAELLDAVACAEPRKDHPHLHYPPNLWEPYRTRRYDNAQDLYASIGVAREDKAGRLAQFAHNARFFGAPVGVLVCVDERMGAPQWIDLGIYLQSLMLLAVQHGLATCPQGYWRAYNHIVTPLLGLPATYRVACGVALGYEDEKATINQWRTPRADWSEWGELRGF